MATSSESLQAVDGGRMEIAGIVGALSTRFTVATGARRRVRRARLDTFDHRLRTAGLVLEHHDMGSSEQLLLSRTDGTAVASAASVMTWPAMADDLPPGPVRDALTPVINIRAVTVVSQETRSIRTLALHNSDSKTVVRVEIDEPASAASAADTPARVTVHSLRGYEREARLATRLLTSLGLVSGTRADVIDQSVVAPSAATPRSAPATELLTAGLRDYLAAMRENTPGLLDDIDTEFLHDYRVAVRRTRATLKLGRPVLPEAMRLRWEPAFKGLGDLTTPVRDLDVYELDLPTMRGWLAGADPADLEPFATHLRRRRTAEHLALVTALRSAQVERLLADWDAALAGTATHGHGEDRPPLSAGQLADRSIGRAFRRVMRRGESISPDSPADDLHTLRKDCKNLRYALEVFSPVLAKGPRKRGVGELKRLQDVLGRFQDTEVQRRALHGFAEEMMADGAPASAVLAMGELIGHLDVEQARARREFDGAFAHFSRQSTHQMMRTLGGRA